MNMVGIFGGESIEVELKASYNISQHLYIVKILLVLKRNMFFFPENTSR